MLGRLRRDSGSRNGAAARPRDPELMPQAGDEPPAWRLAECLGMSETLLARLVRESGAAFRLHMQGRYAEQPRTVAVTPEPRAAPLA